MKSNKMKKFQPMLAVKADLELIKYPCYISRKLDGIRCVIKDGVPYTRKLEDIPNLYIREKLKGLPELDGELMIPGKGFHDVQSAVMSEDGEPDFKFHVFDNFIYPEAPFSQRLKLVRPPNPFVQTVWQSIVQNEAELLRYLDVFIAEGYEGLMVRSPESPYKFGRSTLNEGYLLKVKKFFDDEAVLVRMVEKMTNTNPKTLDKLGNSKRSSHKAGKVPAGTVGTFIALWKGKEIKLGFGEGICDYHKQEFWDNQQNYIGKQLTFTYQEISPKGEPRFGKFVGFRYDI
jgi:DNA ligase-1